MNRNLWIVSIGMMLFAGAMLSHASLTNGLVAYYPFNGNANDASGNGNNGTVNGAVLTNDMAGSTNGAYYFDGGDNITLPAIFSGVQNTFAFSAWIKPVNTSKGDVFIHQATDRNVRLFWSHESTPYYVSWNIDDTSGQTRNLTGGPLALQEWSHIVASYDGAQLQLYLNGIRVSVSNFTANVNWSENAVVDAIGGNNVKFYGSIDEFRIYNRGLISNEVAQLYNLVAYYPFNGNANDESGNGYHGTVNGAALTNDMAGSAGRAYYFDGGDNITLPAIFSGVQNTFAFSAWIKPVNTSKGDVFIHQATDRNVRLFWSHESTPYYVSWNIDDTSGYTRNLTGGPLALQEWSHIVASYNGTQLQLYLNGVRVSVSNFTANVNWSENAVVDAIGGNNVKFYGSIDEFRIYHHALTSNEVQTLYSQTSLSAPSAPSSVSASDGTYTDKVRVTWNTVAGASGYQLFRNTSNSSNGLSVYATTTSTTYDDTSVSQGVNYYYWVKATNAAGASAFSASDVGYLGSAVATLDVPTGLSASDGTYTNLVRLTWNAVSGALYYELWRNTSNNSASASVLAQTTNSVTYDDATVTPGATYSYWVKAKNAQTTSAFSDPDSGYAALSTNTVSGYADLEVSDVILLPATLAVDGHPGAAGLQLMNWGPNDLTTPNTRVILDFYLSKNTTFGDADDLWLGDYQTDVALDAFNYTAVAVTASAREGFTVPSGAAGTNYVFARARHTYPSTLGDSDESNNHALRSGTVKVVSSNDTDTPVAGYHVINDYDGDGKSDLALYREASGEWSILLSDSGYQTATAVLGGQGYKPALADYDGDGKSDLAVYHQASGEWTFMLSSQGYTNSTLMLGGSGYVPVPGDYDGDGLADPIVYHESSGQWQILKSASTYEPVSVSLGGNGYKAVAADFDGDGYSDIAVYRRSTGDWQIMLSSLEYFTVEFQFGGSGFVPVPADYDADGKTDPAVYKDSSGEWRVMLSKYSYLTATATFGGHGYVAVPADYDGDGKGDVVVYSENLGDLRILLSGDGYAQIVVSIGGPGYEPVGYYDW